MCSSIIPVMRGMKLSFLWLQDTIGEIDCQYNVLSITIANKVVFPSLQNDLSVLSRKQKTHSVFIAKLFSLIRIANCQLYSV